MKSDITLLNTWFQDFLVSESPESIGGGYQKDVTNNGVDEDIPKGVILKGRADPSISEDICSALCINGNDLRRYRSAFDKISKLSKPFTYRNALSVRFSSAFQTSILTLLELEDYAKKVRDYDPENGQYVPETDLITYMDKKRI